MRSTHERTSHCGILEKYMGFSRLQTADLSPAIISTHIPVDGVTYSIGSVSTGPVCLFRLIHMVSYHSPLLSPGVDIVHAHKVLRQIYLKARQLGICTFQLSSVTTLLMFFDKQLCLHMLQTLNRLFLYPCIDCDSF